MLPSGGGLGSLTSYRMWASCGKIPDYSIKGLLPLGKHEFFMYAGAGIGVRGVLQVLGRFPVFIW